MKKTIKSMKWLLKSLLFLGVFSHLWAANVPLNHSNFVYQGSPFLKVASDSVAFPRLTDSVMALGQWISGFDGERGMTTTGMVVKVRTTSPSFEIEFIRRDGYNVFGRFFARIDGEVQSQKLNFSPNGSDQFIMTPTLPDDGAEHLVEIILPPFANVVLKRITLADGHEPLPIPSIAQPLYAAVGNSITHGMGQHNTAETFAFQLSEKMGWDLYNFAVGGSSTSPTLAKMITDTIPHLDHISILYGYNDFYYAETPLTEFNDEFTEVIQTYRTAYPDAQIYCISTIVSDNSTSKNGTGSLIDYQKEVDELVQGLIDAGDTKLHLIQGREITQTSQLTDGIHLSAAGAAEFADSLEVKINSFQDGTISVKATQQANIKYSLEQQTLNVYNSSQVKLVDIEGQVIPSITHENHVQYQDLKVGIYFLKVGRQTEKIVVH